MIKLKSLIQESLSNIVYHYTEIRHLSKILKQNRMRLSVAFGTSRDFQQNYGKLYFLSLSRIKFGGYARSEFYEKTPAAIMALDGRKLSHNYKGFPADYWGREFRTGDKISKERMLKNDENEERLISDKPEIKNFKKYIMEVHIYVPILFTNIKALARDREHLYTIDKNFDEIYYYVEPQDFKLLNKRKAITDIDELDLGQEPKPEQPDLPERSDYLPYIDTILQIYNAKTQQDLNKMPERQRKIKTELKYARGYSLKDLISSVRNEVHNNKNDELFRPKIEELGRIIRKTKSKSIAGLLEKMQNKIKKIEE